MAELAARDAGTQAVVADTDRLVLEGVGKVVVSLGHGAHEDADALLRTQRLEIVAHPDHRRFIAHSDFAAVGRQVVGDGVLDDPQQLLLRVGRADGQTVKQLDHQAGESLERAGNADGRVDFDQDSFGGMDVDLELAGLVGRGIEQGKKALDDKQRP